MSLYETRALAQVVAALDEPPSFFLDSFFQTVFTFPTQKVDIDLIDRDKTLAMFVQRGNPSNVSSNKGSSTRSYLPAYIKEKNRIDPSKALARRPGERPSGELTAADRFDAAVADTLDLQMQRIKRRLEWQACRAAIDAQIVIAGDNVASETITFGRNAALTPTALSSTARWGDSAPDILGNIRTARILVAEHSGAAVTDVVLGATAAGAFLADTKVQGVLDNRGAVNLAMNFEPQSGTKGDYLGNIGGLRFWMYAATYTDDAGSSQKFLADNTMFMAGPEMMGTRCFGAIEDPQLGFVEADMAARMFTQDDPPGTFILTQSAPLMVPARPNASLKWVVTA